MQRSSESIAALAAALAKAQIELSNPEKSLVGTIEPRAGEGSQRLFRYAPLSSGLEIVRKALGQHEIATMQTTAIDQTAGIVNLTTVLAHASGEWIASDWPVCAISDTATPRRMGAALTYARRYALFTLVGIAGEDDVDAPDPQGTDSRACVPEKRPNAGNGRSNSELHRQHLSIRGDEKGHSNARRLELPPAASAELRDRLLAELNSLDTGDAAALWAHRCLPEKNRLKGADAQRVEMGFEARLAGFVPHLEPCPQMTPKATIQLSPGTTSEQPNKRRRPPGIDKSVLTVPEPRRIRDREHVRYVAQQPCLVCGRQPSDAHHLRFAQSRALGRKVSDEFTVPVCRIHHRAIHGAGDEKAWWKDISINPTRVAQALWEQSRGGGRAGSDSTASNADSRPAPSKT